jgi:hypothetical protein
VFSWVKERPHEPDDRASKFEAPLNKRSKHELGKKLLLAMSMKFSTPHSGQQR